jgi:oxygen-dependent protoporphyrinogen oxidase
MLGGIHAGHVSEMSASATFPQLLDVAGNSGSLMHALRATLPPSPTDDAPAKPVFNSLDGGVASLISTLVETLSARGVTFATNCRALQLSRQGEDFVVTTTQETFTAEAVIVALPAEPAAHVIRSLDEELGGLLDTISYASVGVITLVVDPELLPPDRHGTGLLVPSTARRRAGTAFLTTAVTYLSKKWPHLARSDDELLRVSVGKIDDLRFSTLSDEQLVAQVIDELSELFKVTVSVRASNVQRWMNALPQYQVNHLLRVAGIEGAAERLGKVAFTGAAIGGVGIPACIGHGRKTGRHVRSVVGA